MSMPAWKIRPYVGLPSNMVRRVGVLIGIVISIVVGYILFGSGGDATPPETPTEFFVPTVEVRDARGVVRPHLMWASAKCLSAVDQSLEQVRAVFTEARSQTRAFAEEALGWDSKFTIVSDYFQQKNDHADFLRQKFESMVISEEMLLSAAQAAISQFQQATVSTEGEMLVRLRADTGDFKYSPITMTPDKAGLQALLQNALSQSGEAAGFDLQAAVGREVASYILGEIATQVGLQLGVSTGILSAGAATGWTSFGISVIVGFAVDQMVQAAYDSAADPKGQLSAQINAQLDAMEMLILDGSDNQSGLRSRLQQFARERSSLRETAVLHLLTSRQGGGL